MKFKINKIHMVGIGGSGMSGIAEVLLNLGYTVSGSDLSESKAVLHLRSLGATVFSGHDRENVGQAEVLVKSTAVDSTNPEVLEAQERGIPVIPRAEMLAELMRLKTGIAVAGTHGKTTTTSLLATIFKEAGLDPTVIIGGRLNQYGSNALMGEGEYLVAEADESDGSFLLLFPIMTVVTNVDADHLDFYPDQEAIDEAFVRFMNQIPFYGTNVICGDDPGLKKLLPRINRPMFTYGFEQGNDLQGELLDAPGRNRFRVFIKGREWAQIDLAQPGRHNVLNALGAIGLALKAGLPKEAIVHGLECFGGVGRRFEHKGTVGDVVVVDDYGHHPTEIEATLTAAHAAYPGRRLVVLFQPHRFTRTRALFGEFCKAFAAADHLVLTEIYAASESPIPGVSGLSLSQGIRQVSNTQVRFCPTLEKCLETLLQIVRPGDVVLTLGAGSVWQVGEWLLQRLSGERG